MESRAAGDLPEVTTGPESASLNNLK